MSDKLKPCPFCGGQGDYYYIMTMRKHWIGCHNCNCATDGYDTEEEAIEAWNTRAELTFPDEVQEAQHNLCELERITGKTWKPERTCKYESTNRCTWVCTSCGREVDVLHYGYNYCPNCGAKVVE